MNWDDYGIAHSRYVDSTGKILGEIKEGYRCWDAFYGGAHIGHYTERGYAKAAVERTAGEEIMSGK